jgi:hypothetical protein
MIRLKNKAGVLTAPSSPTPKRKKEYSDKKITVAENKPPKGKLGTSFSIHIL